jgi:hypothetical protein
MDYGIKIVGQDQPKLKFVIQTVDGKILPNDFCYELLNSITYLEFKNNKKITEIIYADISDLGDGLADYCPVGSVSFVNKWFKIIHDAKIKPMWIPKELDKFCHRKLWRSLTYNRVLELFDDDEELFIKGADMYKHLFGADFFTKKEFEREYNACSVEFIALFQVSEVMPDIVSEWRVFVDKGEFLDARFYSGDTFITPNKSTIVEMIEALRGNSPIAYTMDVCVLSTGSTQIIGCHDFYSCGLYGFTDYGRYAEMVYGWWAEYCDKLRMMTWFPLVYRADMLRP